MTRIFPRMLVPAVMALALTFGASGPGYAADKALLWVMPMLNHPVHKIMQAGFLSRCAQLGVTCEIVGNPSATNWDVPGTIPLAEAALSRTDFGAVAVYGPDPAIYPFITKLASEGFPIVTWHVLPPEGSVDGLLAATAQDTPAAGANAAVAMAEEMGKSGTIALTQGSINETENAMANAFRAKIAQDYPDIKVLETQVEGFEPSAAQAKAVAILQGNPDVTGAFSTTGNGPQTWAQAARAAGRDLTIIGMDYIRQNLDLIRDGKVFGVVAQPLYEESERVAELLVDLSHGKDVPYLNMLPASVITADDLAPYYEILDQAGQ